MPSVTPSVHRQHRVSPLCLRNEARETREKTRKGMRGVRWEADVTSRDPTLKRGRDALLRDPAWHVQKNVQQIELVLGASGFRDRKETDVLQLMGRVARG